MSAECYGFSLSIVSDQLLMCAMYLVFNVVSVNPIKISLFMPCVVPWYILHEVIGAVRPKGRLYLLGSCSSSIWYL